MKHRSKILTWAYWMASREAAAIFVLMGVISQFSHVYFITYEISSLEGIWRILQAIVMSLFFSCGLSYFILKGVKDDDYSDDNIRTKKLIVLFTWIEASINFAYWGGHLIYDPYMAGTPINWFQFAISIPFAVLIPVLLKAYGFSILVMEPSIEPEVIEELVTDIPQNKYNELLERLTASEEKVKTLQKGEFKMKFTGDNGNGKVIDVELQHADEVEPTTEEVTPVKEPAFDMDAELKELATEAVQPDTTQNNVLEEIDREFNEINHK